MKLTVTKLPDSTVELVGELEAPEFAAYRAAALNHLNEQTKIDGFRPGKIPEAVLIGQVGEEKVLLEMAELALQEHYPKMLEVEKIDALGRPAITLTKLAKDNPLGFKIVTAIHPEFTLPEIKTIAAKINTEPLAEIKVEDKEVEEVLAELEKNKADLSKIENPKEKIRDNLKLEKESKEKDKRRLKIIEAIAAETKLELPAVLVESELDKMLAEMSGQIERMGLKFEDYLKHLKKEEKDLRADWRADAEKRVRSALILAKIADAEKIGVPETELAAEVKHLQAHYKDVYPANGGVPESRLRAYVANVLINEYVFRFLENLK